MSWLIQIWHFCQSLVEARREVQLYKLWFALLYYTFPTKYTEMSCGQRCLDSTVIYCTRFVHINSGAIVLNKL